MNLRDFSLRLVRDFIFFFKRQQVCLSFLNIVRVEVKHKSGLKSYQFLLDGLVSALKNLLGSLQDSIFGFQLSDFLTLLLANCTLAAQFHHHTLQL